MNKFCALLCSCLLTCSMFAQFSPYDEILNGQVYAAKVKLVDEFITRFNLEEKRADIPDSKSSDELSLLMLFDLTQMTQQDSTYQLCMSFIHKILEDSITIEFDDKLWYADLTAEVSLLNKKSECHLYLEIEKRQSDMYKWIIAGVDGDIFSLENRVPDLYISPTAHNMDFMELNRLFKETSAFVCSYLPDWHNSDNLSALSVLVANKLLKLNEIKDVKFVFEQVPGYRFYISYYPRETRNSGWLISKLEKRTSL